MTESRIEILHSKKLVGKRLKMSFADDRTPELWRSFMPERKLVGNQIGNNLFSLNIYNTIFTFHDINPNLEYGKLAAVEVSDFSGVPSNMEKYILNGGLYAVFLHKGASSEFHVTFNFIYNVWFPESKYEVDHREHFELLGSKYKNNESDSEEEIWVPVKMK